jgi:hypothetical protein
MRALHLAILGLDYGLPKPYRQFLNLFVVSNQDFHIHQQCENDVQG